MYKGAVSLGSKKIILYQTAAMLILCGNIILGFTIIYLTLDLLDLGKITEHHGQSQRPYWFDQLSRTIYFSAITLFSVGYGDITPYHWSRMVAVIEATIGYVLPAVITVQYLKLFPYSVERWFKNRKGHDSDKKP